MSTDASTYGVYVCICARPNTLGPQRTRGSHRAVYKYTCARDGLVAADNYRDERVITTEFATGICHREILADLIP